MCGALRQPLTPYATLRVITADAGATGLAVGLARYARGRHGQSPPLTPRFIPRALSLAYAPAHIDGGSPAPAPPRPTGSASARRLRPRGYPLRNGRRAPVALSFPLARGAAAALGRTSPLRVRVGYSRPFPPLTFGGWSLRLSSSLCYHINIRRDMSNYDKYHSVRYLIITNILVIILRLIITARGCSRELS